MGGLSNREKRPIHPRATAFFDKVAESRAQNLRFWSSMLASLPQPLPLVLLDPTTSSNLDPPSPSLTSYSRPPGAPGEPPARLCSAHPLQLIITTFECIFPPCQNQSPHPPQPQSQPRSLQKSVQPRSPTSTPSLPPAPPSTPSLEDGISTGRSAAPSVWSRQWWISLSFHGVSLVGGMGQSWCIRQ